MLTRKKLVGEFFICVHEVLDVKNCIFLMLPKNVGGVLDILPYTLPSAPNASRKRNEIVEVQPQ